MKITRETSTQHVISLTESEAKEIRRELNAVYSLQPLASSKYPLLAELYEALGS
jgi:hypothetical protein